VGSVEQRRLNAPNQHLVVARHVQDAALELMQERNVLVAAAGRAVGSPSSKHSSHATHTARLRSEIGTRDSVRTIVLIIAFVLLPG
jgi:hypothetical protein